MTSPVPGSWGGFSTRHDLLLVDWILNPVIEQLVTIKVHAPLWRSVLIDTYRKQLLKLKLGEHCNLKRGQKACTSEKVRKLAVRLCLSVL